MLWTMRNCFADFLCTATSNASNRGGTNPERNLFISNVFGFEQIFIIYEQAAIDEECYSLSLEHSF